MAHQESASESAPKYVLVIEGKEYPWDSETISAAQIAALGGWDISQGVIEVDKNNNERTLGANEVVQLKPGLGFGKKHKWKRGTHARSLG